MACWKPAWSRWTLSRTASQQLQAKAGSGAAEVATALTLARGEFVGQQEHVAAAAGQQAAVASQGGGWRP